jgi:hypothetical protein
MRRKSREAVLATVLFRHRQPISLFWPSRPILLRRGAPVQHNYLQGLIFSER